jgi:prenyltransferase beta subunit
MTFEGGFQGRTNKLVDGCYSFWVGALLPLIQAIQRRKSTRDNQGYYITRISRFIYLKFLDIISKENDRLFDTSKILDLVCL